MRAKQVIDTYIQFFEKKKHVRLPNASLVPENDPTTLFTSSGMQPLIPYLAGEIHPQGKRFVNVQNCFRGQGALDDINEVGDNRHLTFFRMLGNWSLGDYFKKEQLPWMFEYLTKILGIAPEKLSVSVFEGADEIPKDTESIAIWTELFESVGLNPQERIFFYGPRKNWWSRAGIPENMPIGELGGPDSEIFYDFGTKHDSSFGKTCHINCDCGRYLEISNNVFMQYKKSEKGFDLLPQQNVDHGAGAERLVMATENEPDVFLTSLFKPVIEVLEKQTGTSYEERRREMRMITAHLSSSCFIINAQVSPSNTEQGYILRRLIRRATDSFSKIGGKDVTPIIEQIIEQYSETDPDLSQTYERSKGIILEEMQKYQQSLQRAKAFLIKKYPSVTPQDQVGDDLMGVTEISADDAFVIYTTHGLSPTQIKSLGYTFDDKTFADKMKTHKDLSRSGAEKKFKGGLADHEEKTVMGHTATHLLHQALRDVLGNHVHQTGSNITTERLRFDFNYDQKLTDDQLQQVETIVTSKIKDNLPVHFEIMTQDEAEALGAIGLFKDTYGDKVKIYFIGDTSKAKKDAYSIEYCGGPHVDFTGQLKTFKIIKQENLGKGQKRIYAVTGN